MLFLKETVKAKRIQAAQSLLESIVEINTRDDLGMTLLHIAAESGYREIVKLCLAKNVDASIKDDNGKAPLFYSD